MKKIIFTAIVLLIVSQGCSQRNEKRFVDWAKEIRDSTKTKTVPEIIPERFH